MKFISANNGLRLLFYSSVLASFPCTALARAHASPYGVVYFQQTISGTVSDSSGPLPGVTIMVKGTNRSVVSDSDGKFSIMASPDEVLVFSFLGYKTVEVVVGDQSALSVTLVEDATQLEEVEINAGYYAVKKRESTGNISRITTKDIETQPVSNPLGAMSGRMAGVTITQSSGTPGSGFSIKIRGINSLRSDGNEPLYIIDGVPYASQSLANSYISGTNFAGIGSPLGNLNPSDIQSIEVLKDADATAIYGSRGANGVVLITTKKGKAGKTRVELQSYSTFGTITRKMDLLDTQQYLAMRQEAFANDGITEYPADAYDINGTWDPQRYTDWQKKLIGGTANIHNTQLSISGGSANTQFTLGGTYRKETTVFPDDNDFKRAAVHSNLSHSSEDGKFALNFSANYVHDKNTLPGVDLTRQAYTLAPNAPALYDSEGNLNWEGGTFENPLAYLNSQYLNDSRSLITNAVLSYSLPYGFRVKANLGYSDLRLSEVRTFPYTIFNPFYNLTSANSEVMVNDGTRSSWVVEPQLEWKHNWESFEITALAGTTFQSQQQATQAFYGSGFASNSLINSLAAANTVTVLDDYKSEYNYTAAFGRINLSLKDRYILNLTGRRDGSSRFGADNRFANFGAVGAAWIFSEEPFLPKKTNALSFGKLRMSYGFTGNDQIGDYQFLDSYQVSSNYYGGVTGLQPSRLYNPNFGWETNKKLEAGLELGFLKDRIAVSASYFHNRSTDQLVGIPLPGTTGFTSLQANLPATVENTGLELEWQSQNITGTFKWVTGFNITIPKNKLVAFPGLSESTYKNRYIIGESINIRRLYHYTGIDPETGLYTVEDANGDGQISTAGDLTAFVDLSPKYYGGLSNQFTYKNWSLDVLFQFVKQQGSDILSSYLITGSLSNQPVGVTNHFPQDGTGAFVQQYSSGNYTAANQAYNNYTQSDAMIRDASFIRLKSLNLSYNLPKLLSGVLAAKIYFQGQNLLTFTNYNGADPENQSGFYLPPLKQYTLGVQLTFN
jgi:TonB-dependent starch-binding outer membrane protein SusC